MKARSQGRRQATLDELFYVLNRLSVVCNRIPLISQRTYHQDFASVGTKTLPALARYTERRTRSQLVS